MDDKFALIQFTAKDWEIYKGIRLESLKSDPQAFGSNLKREEAFNEEKWKARLAPFSNTSKSITVGIKDNSTNRVVGTMASFSTEKEIAVIVGVFILNEYRGMKLANYLMAYLIEIINSKNEFKRIQLSVSKEQTSAVMLYKKFGFNVVREEDVVLGDGVKHREFVMELPLQ